MAVVPTLPGAVKVFFYDTDAMFLRAKTRIKDGKAHRYWSIVENRRTRGHCVVQRQVFYLGEINDSQQARWCKTIEVFQGDESSSRQLAIFAEDRIDSPPSRWWMCIFPRPTADSSSFHVKPNLRKTSRSS